MVDQTEHEPLAISARDYRFYAFQALGGGHSITDMLQMISRGFPSGKVIRLAAEYEIPEALLQKTLHISPSTFQRRKRGGRFTVDESDRFVRILGLYGMAADVLGSKHAASGWMSTPNQSLGGVSPAGIRGHGNWRPRSRGPTRPDRPRGGRLIVRAWCRRSKPVPVAEEKVLPKASELSG